MARRKTNDLENQMSLMDMMASESPEYTEEGPEELLDPGEDMGDIDVLPPLTEWDSMLTQCSYRVFQQHKAAGYTIFR